MLTPGVDGARVETPMNSVARHTNGGGTSMSRKVTDCRDTPNLVGCTLVISGEEEEVVRAAVEHAISVHGDEDTQELRDGIRASLKDKVPASATSAS